jgi:hypothetical protein
MSSSIIEAIKHYADVLGRSICESFSALDFVIQRQESLIRRRWNKKSQAQRREVLLTAWPGMPHEYRPDQILTTMPYSKHLEVRKHSHCFFNLCQ